MAIVFSRIDDRYVHGQVGARIVKQYDVEKVLLVDDKVAADDFMKQIYVFSGNACGAEVVIYSVADVISAFKNGDFNDPRCLLLFGNIDTAYRTTIGGVEYEELDVASIKGKGADATQAINNVFITSEDARKLKEIKAKGVNAYFQVLPGVDTQVSIEDGIKNAGY